MTTPYETPKFHKDAFNCPYCNAYSKQNWSPLYANFGSFNNRPDLNLSVCTRCNKTVIWDKDKMVYPYSSSAPLPNTDLPEDVKLDFNEARNIVSLSPRSACVLLRLSIEKICDNLGAKGRDLNEKIGVLVQKGMDERIQKALDSVRVIGGQAVHPLEMDLKDDVDTANSLFELVNLISDWAYTQKKKIEDIYSKLPQGKKEAIERRDGKPQNP